MIFSYSDAKLCTCLANPTVGVCAHTAANCLGPKRSAAALANQLGRGARHGGGGREVRVVNAAWQARGRRVDRRAVDPLHILLRHRRVPRVDVVEQNLPTACNMEGCRVCNMEGCRVRNMEGCIVCNMEGCRVCNMEGCRVCNMEGCRVYNMEGCRVCNMEGCIVCSMVCMLHTARGKLCTLRCWYVACMLHRGASHHCMLCFCTLHIVRHRRGVQKPWH